MAYRLGPDIIGMLGLINNNFGTNSVRDSEPPSSPPPPPPNPLSTLGPPWPNMSHVLYPSQVSLLQAGVGLPDLRLALVSNALEMPLFHFDVRQLQARR